MLDTTSPYLSYIAITYCLALVVLLGILCIQLRQHRKVRRQLEIFKEKS